MNINKEFIIRNKNKILIAIFIIAILILAFILGDEPSRKTASNGEFLLETGTDDNLTETMKDTENTGSYEVVKDTNNTEDTGSNEVTKDTKTEVVQSDETTESADLTQSQSIATIPETTIANNKAYCTISISCSTLLNNMDKLNTDKKECVPDDGWILQETVVEIQDGDTVFDILKRVTKENKIHMEFSGSGKAGTAYIEGINNIYEFDCGSISGWLFSVNDEFFSSGSSNYKISAGDKIEWMFSCDLGKDVGNTYNGE